MPVEAPRRAGPERRSRASPKRRRAAVAGSHREAAARRCCRNKPTSRRPSKRRPPLPSAEEQVKVIGPLRIGIALYNVYLNEADEWSRQLATEVGEWALESHQRVADSTIGLAHSLAGSSATVGFQSLSGMARLFEAALQHLQMQGSGTPQQGTVLVAAAEELAPPAASVRGRRPQGPGRRHAAGAARSRRLAAAGRADRSARSASAASGRARPGRRGARRFRRRHRRRRCGRRRAVPDLRGRGGGAAAQLGAALRDWVAAPGRHGARALRRCARCTRSRAAPAWPARCAWASWRTAWSPRSRRSARGRRPRRRSSNCSTRFDALAGHLRRLARGRRRDPDRTGAARRGRRRRSRRSRAEAPSHAVRRPLPRPTVAAKRRPAAAAAPAGRPPRRSRCLAVDAHAAARGVEPGGARPRPSARPPGQPGRRGQHHALAHRSRARPDAQVARRPDRKPRAPAPPAARHRAAGRNADAVAPGAGQGFAAGLRSARVRPLHALPGTDADDGRVGQRRRHRAAHAADDRCRRPKTSWSRRRA